MERYSGLSESEVNEKRNKFGLNELPTQKPKSILSLIFSVVKEPMILLLIAGGLIYFFLGEPKDAFILGVSIFVVIGITLYQENKTENALKALRDLSSPRALVVRNGEQIRIAGKEVVKEDVVLLQEGDRVPADALIISEQNLYIDESLLTGESLPVKKNSSEMGEKYYLDRKTIGDIDKSCIAYSGTLISQGSGVAVVFNIGVKTELGKIGKILQSVKKENSLLKKEIDQVVKIFGILGLISCITLIIFHYAVNQHILNAFLAGITLSMAMLPEEFPVVLLIFLTLGAWRLSKKNVLTRNNQAIETLGATSVLCVDKTGTLTFNKMELVSIVSGNGIVSIEKNNNLSPIEEEILFYAKLAGKRNAFDPLEKEINNAFEKIFPSSHFSLKDCHLKKEYPITKELFAKTRIWETPETQNGKTEDTYLIASKGAPEAIINLCALDNENRKKIMKYVADMSDRGQRVLAVAKAEYNIPKNSNSTSYPENITNLSFNYLGLIGFADPIRPTVGNSVQECYKAGIKVIMITGDYPGTAKYIASQAGIKNYDQCITGDELNKLTDEELREKIKEVNIFARVVPEQKLTIIDALKSNGEIVAMTGDGINDGPALKSAHIGVAMGERGTDVAREASDIVLLDDNFTSIVSAIKMGRRIYDNLQKAVSYIFSIHIPIAGLALIPTFFNLPAIFYPIHIAFLELIIDPACSTVFESEHSENEIMSRKPRNLNNQLFGKNHILIAFLHGFTILLTTSIVFFITHKMGLEENSIRSITFATLVMCNLSLILADLSNTSVLQKFSLHRNKAFYFISVGAVLLMGIFLGIPFFNNLFHFSPLDMKDILIVLFMSLLCYIWLEFFKIFRVNTEKYK